MNTKDLTVDCHIEHAAHGAGTVTFVGADYIGIRFDNQQEALIRREELEQSAPTPLVPKAAQPDLPWPASTFVPEPADAAHFFGSHWDAFFEDSKDIMVRLPEIASNAMPQTGYGEHRKPQRSEPEDWPKGFELVWPLREKGVALVLKPEAQANKIVSIFPFCTLGSQLTLTLQEVRVWRDGMAAQVTACWADAEVTFFDTQFLINRIWYQVGQRYDFIVSGVAYSAGPAATRDFPVQYHPDQVTWMNLRRQPGEEPIKASTTMHMQGAAMFLPVDGWDVDDYSFHAPVKSVTEFTDWLGQDGWRVCATVMRFGDIDADLDILITRRAWTGTAPPQVGQDIHGSLWLQGYLWMPESPPRLSKTKSKNGSSS